MRHILLAAAAVTLASCSGGDNAEAPADAAPMEADAMASGDMAAPPADMAAPPAAEYAAMAGASDLYEIQSSRAVLQTTQNAEVRRFAQMMVEQHTGTMEAVSAAAREAGLTPAPPALDSAKTAMMRDLEAAEGAARDAVYIRQQVMAHEQALALHRAYSGAGDQPALKAAATSAVPIVERHLAEIRRMQTAMASNPGQ